MRRIGTSRSRLSVVVFGMAAVAMYLVSQSPAQTPTPQPDSNLRSPPAQTGDAKSEELFTRFRREAMYDSLSRAQRGEPWSDAVLGTYVEVYSKTKSAGWAEIAAGSVDRFGRKVYDAYRKGER